MERTVDILIEVSLYSAVITAFILLFRAVFKKRISPKVQYMMWLLLVLRLMLPATIESGFHIESILPELTTPVIQQEIIFDNESPVISEMPAVNMTPITEITPEAAQPAFDIQGENAASAITQEIPEIAPAAVPEVIEPARNINWRLIAFWVWAAGAMIFSIWMMIVKLRFYEDMQQGITSVSPRAYAIYDECCAALNVKPLTMWAVDRAISPGIAFFTYPVLLLPASMDGDEDKLRYAFLHELTHKKRYDHYMTVLLNVLRILYWFNPAVHIGFAEMRSDMETACDAEVIAFVGKEQKRGYLTAILELFSYATRPQLGMSQASSRRMARRRMKGAFMREKTTFLGRAAALMLAVIMLVGCFTTACQSAPVEAEEVAREAAPVNEVETEEPLPDPNEVQTHLWSESYLAAGSVKVNVNAELDIPVSANYPVYQVEYSEFTKENLKTITDAVIGKVTDVELKTDYSQDYLDMGYITEAYLEENCPTETEISPYSNYYCKDENGTDWEIFTRARSVTVGRNPLDDYNIQAESVVIAGDAYIGEPAGTTLNNVKISREEAVQIAQEAINSLGLTNAELYNCEKARAINHSHKTLTEGWKLDYIYSYGAFPSIHIPISQTIYKEFENHLEPLRCDRLSMFVDETGIVRYESTTPSRTIATLNDTRIPLTFEETKESIKAVIDDITQTVQGYPLDYELKILDISLCSCIVQNEYNAHAGYMIPAWMVETTFGDSPEDALMNYSQIFISAIDGTMISNHYMTENGRRIAREYDSGMYVSNPLTPEDTALRDAILRLYPLADEIAEKGFTAVLGQGWLEESEALFQTVGLRLGGAGMTGTDYLGYTVETPEEYCSSDLCHMYAAVLFAAVPNLYEINIGNSDYITYNTYLDDEHEHLLATAVGDIISREDAAKHWAGLAKPLEEYGVSGSGIRELLRSIADMSGIELASAELAQETPLHVSLLQPTPTPQLQSTPIPALQPTPTPQLQTTPIPASANFANAIAAKAKTLVGKPYKKDTYGHETFDSAGLVYYVLFNEGVEVTKQSCQEYSTIGSWKKIEDKGDLQSGDILFFYGDDFTEINHAAIYIGDNKMIDASSSNGKVIERSWETDYWQEHFAFARRVA